VTANEDMLVLVDERDREIGVAPKMRVHVEGLRHRAISVLVVNAAGELLLQRRNDSKYHSGGLWTNSCCSHPRPGETPHDAATRRLREEMGFSTPLEPMFTTSYKAPVGDLIENEVVHVFGGYFDGRVEPDAAEVDAYEWRSPSAIAEDMAAHPERYTVWFVKYMGEFRASVDRLASRVRVS
jgi:isopentenyl-diphosphate delta-isomerase